MGASGWLFRIALTASALSIPAWAHGASLTALGGPDSEAHGVSDDGRVAVGVIRNFDESHEAFRWTSTGGMVGLGDLPGGGVGSSASGASGDGSVVVGYGTREPGREAFRWTTAGGIVALGALPGDTESSATAVSTDGTVVVGSSSSVYRTEAFRWTSAGGMVGLGFLPGNTNSWAEDVSADGNVVVGRIGGVSSGGQAFGQAFRWTSAGGMVGLYSLPGHNESWATAVSADGKVVVGWSAPTNSGWEAFRWTSAGGMQGLGFLPGHETSLATDVSADGNVVIGWSGVVFSFSEAFIWTPSAGMRRLADVLAANGATSTTPWLSLVGANAITPDGQWVVGYGQNTSDSFPAFLANLSPSGGDSDGDGIEDSQDNCPAFGNASQSDIDDNGIGDACECGDQNGDGRVNVSDLVSINIAIFRPELRTELCDTTNDDQCNIADIVGASRKILGRPAYCWRYPPP